MPIASGYTRTGKQDLLISISVAHGESTGIGASKDWTFA
jgi:hypothetical protein